MKKRRMASLTRFLSSKDWWKNGEKLAILGFNHRRIDKNGEWLAILGFYLRKIDEKTKNGLQFLVFIIEGLIKNEEWLAILVFYLQKID